ncbi:hypothetical protein HAX54_042010 [Datura stramonium]|uniref:Uncharacterized protein n=1 Tax=Datura stramonium TaxID=4076 RepID=A0ABS8W3F1_DATST|nr:hypothetical protein [Datura stramonium]
MGGDMVGDKEDWLFGSANGSSDTVTVPVASDITDDAHTTQWDSFDVVRCTALQTLIRYCDAKYDPSPDHKLMFNNSHPFTTMLGASLSHWIKEYWGCICYGHINLVECHNSCFIHEGYCQIQNLKLQCYLYGTRVSNELGAGNPQGSTYICVLGDTSSQYWRGYTSVARGCGWQHIGAYVNLALFTYLEYL